MLMKENSIYVSELITRQPNIKPSWIIFLKINAKLNPLITFTSTSPEIFKRHNEPHSRRPRSLFLRTSLDKHRCVQDRESME